MKEGAEQRMTVEYNALKAIERDMMTEQWALLERKQNERCQLEADLTLPLLIDERADTDLDTLNRLIAKEDLLIAKFKPLLIRNANSRLSKSGCSLISSGRATSVLSQVESRRTRTLVFTKMNSKSYKRVCFVHSMAAPKAGEGRSSCSRSPATLGDNPCSCSLIDRFHEQCGPRYGIMTQKDGTRANSSP